MIHITGWGAFWLAVGAIGLIKLLSEALLRMYYVRQIVKLLDAAIEEHGIREEEIDMIRNMIDIAKR